MTNTFYRTALKASTALVAVAAFAAPGYAQVDESATAAQNQDSENATPAVVTDPIVITGSRISNPNLVQSSPVQVVGENEAALRQATNAEELIGELPGISPGINSSVNNGSAGFSSLNLRNLGTNRNLVLLDGTRLVPTSLAGTVDLNIIPLALIERVEVVTGGASSVYGADAISGVANFVLKRDFSGAEIVGTTGITEAGDGFRVRGDVTLGANFDDGRGNASKNVGYQKIDGVLQGNRSISQDTFFYDGSEVGSGTAQPTRITSLLDGDDNSSTNQYDPETGQLVPTYNTYNFAPDNYFQTPLERFNVFADAHYEVADNVEVYTRGMFTKSIVDLQLAPSGLFGDTWQFPLNNPFINDTIRNQICGGAGVSAADCAAAGAATDPTDDGYLEVPVTINRRLIEMGPRQTRYTTNQFQIWTGVRGSLTDTIDYDVYATYGESDRRQNVTNWGLKSRVQQALRAIDADTCVDTSNGCSPINLFGDGLSVSDESIAFFNQPAGNTVQTTLFQANASLSGDLGEQGFLTDTPVGFALGAEYRDYGASQVSDVSFGTQDEVMGTGAPSPSFSGGYDVKEVFGELIVPILEDIPGIYSLTAEGGIRYSDYSNTGTSTTWKAGGTYEPFEGYRVRGIYQRAVRSPNISELFSPVVTGLTALSTDPCAGSNPVGNAALTAICIAQGAPSSQIGNIPTPNASQANATAGGNPDLDVEKAKSYTVGLVLQPPQVPGLAITADYYNIKVTDAITNPTPGDILVPCYGQNNDGQGSDPAACQNIVRNPLNGSVNGGGDTPGLILQLTNQGTIETTGVDLRVAYSIPASFGAVNFDFNGNWVDKLKFRASPTSLNRECVGYYSENCEPITPEYTFNFRTTLSLDAVDVSVLWTWLDGVDLEPIGAAYSGALEEYRSISAYNYFDLTARFRATENFELTAGVNNLFDKKPPLVSNYVGSSSYNSGNTYPTTYDALGRRMSITGRLTF
ncbi:TonB-dependent receptor domain-containing protein [Pacificimonas flava]|uniref:TonB-dependent receptor domain-containing protein n=1 Tax=Pacificimonas flava TaxID=1234595 RepID=UPI0016113311|nr:outer membrane receptor protein involved in Fe transport [Pacificimonas flava]